MFLIIDKLSVVINIFLQYLDARWESTPVQVKVHLVFAAC